MSQIMTIARTGFSMIAFVMLMTACGTSTENNKTVYNASKGNHAVDWKWAGHAAEAQNDLNVCKGCHGQDLSGGVAAVNCSSCHVNGIGTMTGCVSCHAVPPSGTATPNRRGAHTVHEALVNITGICGTCHANAGSGTNKHANGTLEVNFLSLYNAKSGTAVRNADDTCSNVSCHGGQTTPVWNIGMLDVNNDCTSCHSFGFSYDIPQYNSFSSGQHYYHAVVRGMGCFSCHDTAKLAAQHFTTLDTSAMEGLASATIQDYVGYVPATSTCLLGCHAPKVW